MCYTPECLITSLNSDLGKWLRIKNVPKMMGFKLQYVNIVFFFFLQRENQFIRIHSELGKDLPTTLENSSGSHHPKNVISRKL